MRQRNYASITRKGSGLLLSAALLLQGCGGSSGTSTPKEATPQDAGPMTVTWMNILNTPEQPLKDTELFKKIEEKIGAKLEFNWVPSAAYSDKLAAMIASNDLPKVVLLENTETPFIVNAVTSGMFWELGPYLKDYPNLSKANPKVVAASSIGGKVVGIYRERDLSDLGMVIRKDWLDNIGLPMPKTIDDLYNVAKAFTNNDPDKNGKNDTVGFAEGSGAHLIEQSSIWFGAPNRFGVSNNKLVPDFDTPEYLQGLNYVKKLYHEKLVNQDFALIDSNQKLDLFKKGKAGISVNSVSDWAKMYDDMKKLFPTVQLDLLNTVSGPKGERILAVGGFYGVYAIPKTSVKTETELKKLLTVLDKMNTPELVNMMMSGLEGVHYKLDSSGRVVINTEIYGIEVRRGLAVLPMLRPGRLLPSESDPAKKALGDKANQLKADNEKISVVDPTRGSGIQSETMKQQGAALNKMISDGRIKYILDNMDDAGWKKTVADWYKAGGQKGLDELNQQWSAIKK